MRFVVYGAGAVGGVVAARLHEAGQDTVVIARGEHLDAIREHGLTLATREGRATYRIPAVADPADVEFRAGDVALLATKSQDTRAAVDRLAAVATPDLPVACVQNGVANERAALRVFPDVYGVVVMLPATYLVAGAVAAHSSPVTGVLDVGRWPSGADALAGELSAALEAAGFASRPLDDAARRKYRKLLDNLSNVVDALCGSAAREGPVTELAREEGRRCLDAAGIPYTRGDDDRRAGLLDVGEADGQPRKGSSTWQSLARGTGAVETDYLNGEIVLLGRLHGVPTPANATLQRLAREHAASRRPPEAVDADELLDLVRRAGG